MKRLILAALATLALLACSDSSTGPGSRLASLWIVSDVDTLAIGDSLRVTAVGADADGNEVGEARVRWSSSDDGVARVDSLGRVTGISSGAVMITAEAGGRRAYAEIVVIPPGSRFADVVGAWTHSCALAVDARIYCGGWNQYGMIGNGTGLYGEDGGEGTTHIGRVAGDARFRSLSAFGLHTCALSLGGDAYCWGLGSFGRLGTTTYQDCQSQPGHAVVVPCHVRPALVGSGYKAVSAGLESSCGLRTDGRAVCWGDNSRGALGSSGYQMWGLPLPVAGDMVFESLSAGRNHVCATTPDSRAFCWGSNYRGQLGSDGVPTCVAQSDGCYARQPYAVLGGRAFTAVDAGGFHSCGLTTTQEVYCWGDNTFGQLGDGTMIGSLLPRRAGTQRFASVSVGDFHTCAISVDGRTYCWGLNDDGQLGAVSADTCRDAGAPYPCAVSPLEVGGAHRYARLEMGLYHSCGVTVEGEARCWGWNLYGQLANGGYTGGTVSTPVHLSAAAEPLGDASPPIPIVLDTARYALPSGPALRFSLARE